MIACGEVCAEVQHVPRELELPWPRPTPEGVRRWRGEGERAKISRLPSLSPVAVSMRMPIDAFRPPLMISDSSSSASVGAAPFDAKRLCAYLASSTRFCGASETAQKTCRRREGVRQRSSSLP